MRHSVFPRDRRDPDTYPSAGLTDTPDADPYLAVDDAFARAAQRCPEHLTVAHYRFAGRIARVRVVGHLLAEHLDGAFAHLALTDAELASAEDDLALRVDLWDEAETGVPAPAWPASRDRGWAVGGGYLASLCGGRIVRHALDQSTLWLEREAGHLIGAVTDARTLSLHERGKPLYYLLSMWHNDRDAYVVHAGFVARGNDGVLIVGPGGAGKSTTALASLAGGLTFLGDDSTAIERRGDGTFVGHSVYSVPWIELDHLRRFPTPFAAAAVRGTRPEDEKAMVRLTATHPARLARSAMVRAVCLPRVVEGSGAHLRPATKAEALLAVGPSSILLFAPSPGAEGLRTLAALVHGVPAWWLELGTDLETIPGCIRTMLDAGAATS